MEGAEGGDSRKEIMLRTYAWVVGIVLIVLGVMGIPGVLGDAGGPMKGVFLLGQRWYLLLHRLFQDGG